MTADNTAESFVHQKSVAATSLLRSDSQIARSLTVAVLGPKLGQGGTNAVDKRSQIFHLVEGIGHKPFYPETVINIDLPWIFGEEAVLSSPQVDLVILLHTQDSWGVAVEIGAFSQSDAIRSKTVILLPKEYSPDNNLLSNTAEVYPIKVRYTNRQYEECSLIEECRNIANEFLASGMQLVRDLGK